MLILKLNFKIKKIIFKIFLKTNILKDNYYLYKKDSMIRNFNGCSLTGQVLYLFLKNHHFESFKF